MRQEATLRRDGREDHQLRPVSIQVGAQAYAEGSALIRQGETHVLCAVSVEERVPPFLKGTGRGWITAEYAMLPRATLTRTPRESRAGGRAQEIRRLIGRALRAAVDLEALGERTLVVDCDVLQADGGTRTAAVTGGFVALRQAIHTLRRQGVLTEDPVLWAVAAVSVGLVEGRLLLDLCYEEDFQAQADFNLVLTDRGQLVEVQGTAEDGPFDPQVVAQVLELADRGARSLFQAQRSALQSAGIP